jgi:hypothetical protein
VISIAVGDPPEQADAFLRRVGGHFPVIPDPDQKIANAYAVNGFPHNVFIDRSGQIQQVIEGYSGEALEKAAAQAVGNS